MSEDPSPPLFDPEANPPRQRKFPGKSGPRGRVTPTSMTKADKQARALELRRQGYTYREIGKEMRITHKEAHKLVTEAYRDAAHKTAETAEQMVQLHNERLDWMFKGLATQIEHGNARAIEVAVKLLDRQAKLLGLDAPAKQEVKVRFDQLTDQELLEETRRLRVNVEQLTGGQLLLPGETALPSELEKEIRSVIDAEYTVKDQSPDASS